MIFIEGSLYIFPGDDERVIKSGARLLALRYIFEVIHDIFELVFRTLRGCVPVLVNLSEIHIVFFRHIVRTSATVLDSGGEANIRRRLREDGFV